MCDLRFLKFLLQTAIIYFVSDFSENWHARPNNTLLIISNIVIKSNS